MNLIYFAMTIACLMSILFAVMICTSEMDDARLPVDSFEFTPLPPEVDRAAMTRVDVFSDNTKDFSKA
jgi:hypothetical protein